MIQLNPQENHESYNPTQLYRDKKYVVATESTEWPDLCYKSGEPADNKITLTRSYTSLLFALTIFLPILLSVFMGLFGGKSLTMTFAVSDRHLRQRKMFKWTQMGFVLLLVGSIALIIADVDARYQTRVVNSALAIVGSLSLLVVLVIAIVSKTLHAAKFKKYKGHKLFWIKGTGQTFRDQLPDLPELTKQPKSKKEKKPAKKTKQQPQQQQSGGVIERL